MWPDRYTVYYSREKRYAVRWLDIGRPESEAQFQTFDERDGAERLYETLTKSQGDKPTTRVEIFFAEVKWIAFQSNEDESHTATTTGPVGHSSLCQSGEHHACADGDDAAWCTCWCHAPLAL